MSGMHVEQRLGFRADLKHVDHVERSCPARTECAMRADAVVTVEQLSPSVVKVVDGQLVAQRQEGLIGDGGI